MCYFYFVLGENFDIKQHGMGLTHCVLVMLYADIYLGLYWPWQHQYVTWVIIDFLLVRLCAIHIDKLVQERYNSIANALELRVSCTNPLTWEKFTVSAHTARSPSGPWVNLKQDGMGSKPQDRTEHIHGSVQERHYSIANALELCLSWTNP